MPGYEYKVVPAPARGEKARGLKTGADRFAYALAQVMNALGREGWEYVRADTLPSEERTGFAKRSTVYHNLLVFRRALPDATDPAPDDTAAPQLLTAEARIGEAPRIVLQGEGAAPHLGPATGRSRDDVDA